MKGIVSSLPRGLRGPRVHDYFTKADRDRITQAVKDAEAKTIGEIRVKVVSDCKGPTRPFAVEEFFREGVHQTRNKTGVLILLILRRRVIEVVADEGINNKVPQDTWNLIVQRLSAAFAIGDYTNGLVAAVRQVGLVLYEHFPMKPGDVDELPDEPILEEEE